MKFGQKIFLITFILVILSVNIIGIMMINNNYKTNIDLQIEKGIMQINTLANNLDLYNAFNVIMQIANQYLRDNIYMEITIGDTLLYSNLEENYTKAKEQLNNVSENIKVYIENKQLFIRLNKNSYSIITKTDISEIYQMKEEQIHFFVQISLISSFGISFILLVAVFLSTRRIHILNKATKEIAKGKYDVKIPNLGKDEIGELGTAFSNMTNSVKQNIEEINKTAENREKFIGNLTHEIRTPLTSIIGYSSLIKNKKITQMDKIIESSEKIYEEGSYIKEMSDKLMELVLLDNQTIQLEKMNLSEELIKIVQRLQDTYKEIKFELEIAKNVFLLSDKILLKILISNLVKNSINAYENNPIIKIQLKENGELNVIDYGKGIPKQELEKIKNPFYTLNENRNREISGMGLGLPLCMKIVEIHHGTFEIESEEGKGTKISIQLGENQNEKN